VQSFFFPAVRKNLELLPHGFILASPALLEHTEVQQRAAEEWWSSAAAICVYKKNQKATPPSHQILLTFQQF